VSLLGVLLVHEEAGGGTHDEPVIGSKGQRDPYGMLRGIGLAKNGIFSGEIDPT
jgi:hypothetical protein